MRKLSFIILLLSLINCSEEKRPVQKDTDKMALKGSIKSMKSTWSSNSSSIYFFNRSGMLTKEIENWNLGNSVKTYDYDDQKRRREKVITYDGELPIKYVYTYRFRNQPKRVDYYNENNEIEGYDVYYYKNSEREVTLKRFDRDESSSEEEFILKNVYKSTFDKDYNLTSEIITDPNNKLEYKMLAVYDDSRNVLNRKELDVEDMESENCNFEYDKLGNVVKEKCGDKITFYRYVFDSKKNWIEKESRKDNDSVFTMRASRIIEYY